GPAIEDESPVTAQQHPRGAHAQADPGGFADVGEREVAHALEDGADIGEGHAVDDADERDADLVVDHEHRFAAERDAIGADWIPRLLAAPSHAATAHGK